MSFAKLVATLPLLVAAATAGNPQQPPTAEETALQQKIAERNAALTEARVAGLGSLSVNGVALAPEAVMREAIFLVGAKHIDARIADFFIEDHKQEAIANGRDPKDFEISDEELTRDVAALVDEFQKKNPGISLWEAVRAQFGMDRERYLHTRKQTILFDRVFFPGPATNWPVITREAIMASSQGGDGKSFWDNLEKASVDPEGKPRELPAFWMQLCRGWVQKQLKSWSDIRYPSDGLPAELCLAVNERSWPTKDAFELVRHGLYLQDIERAMTEVAVRESLRQALVASNSYMSDEEFRAEFDTYRQEYDNTPFTTEIIAINFKGYPSLEAFRQRWRLMRSYERMIADDINDESLQKHGEKFSAFFGNGSVIVDAIQFLGRDPQTAAWLPNGMDEARVRSEKAMAEIEAGADFDEMINTRGEYYTNDKDRGHLGSKPLNQLRQQLRETEFTDLFSGMSLGYFLFFDAEPRQVYGPMRGPEGYYIARVNARVPSHSAISVADPRTRELIRQDYVNYRFREWAQGIIGKADIK